MLRVQPCSARCEPFKKQDAYQHLTHTVHHMTYNTIVHHDTYINQSYDKQLFYRTQLVATYLTGDFPIHFTAVLKWEPV